jgi:hypothetical protein
MLVHLLISNGRNGLLVFNNDAFSFEIFIESFFAQIFPESRLLEPAERGRHIRLVVGVDEAGSGMDFLRHFQSLNGKRYKNHRKVTYLAKTKLLKY